MRVAAQLAALLPAPHQDEFNTLRDEMLYYMTMDRLVASMGEEAPLAVLQDVANHGQSAASP